MRYRIAKVLIKGKLRKVKQMFYEGKWIQAASKIDDYGEPCMGQPTGTQTEKPKYTYKELCEHEEKRKALVKKLKGLWTI